MLRGNWNNLLVLVLHTPLEGSTAFALKTEEDELIFVILNGMSINPTMKLAVTVRQ